MKQLTSRRGDFFKGTLKVLALVLAAVALCLGCSSKGGGGGGGDDGGGWTLGGMSGTISLPARLQLDSDTPDPNNPQVDNGTTATAQPIKNLVDVAGYADSLTDVQDYFSVSLTAGETVYLKIADGSTANLDLYLYQGGSLQEASTSLVNQVETVAAPANGDYLILVKAVAGGSIYNLVVGLSAQGTATGLQAGSPDQDFVPGEAIVKFKTSGPSALIPAAPGQEGAAMSGARFASARAQADDFAAARGALVHGFDPRGLALFHFPDAAAADDEGDGAPDADSLPAASRATLQRIRELNNDPMVAYAEPNYILHAAVIPGDTYYYLQWNMDHISMPAAWDTDQGDPSVIIAVVDTGVLYDHPDLAANILKYGSAVVGYDMISDPGVSLDGNGCDPDPYDVGDRELKYGNTVFSSFHGTHVGGIASAATNNHMGVAGVGWKTKIMPVRVLGHGGGTLYDVAQGIYYAAGLANACGAGALPKIGDTVTPANIINLSLGGTSSDPTLQSAVSAARAAGVIVIAAAGNNNTSAPFYPAAYDGVVGVSAVGFNGTRAPYSNYGSYVDIAAPGGNLTTYLNGNTIPGGSPAPDGILSTLGDDSTGTIFFGYGFYQGTSMAAPHVSGVAALMKYAFDQNAPPGAKFNPIILDDLIQGTIGGGAVGSITNYPKGTRDSNLGYGLIDAPKAVDAAVALAGDTPALAPQVTLEPSHLDFGFDAEELSTFAANRGLSTLTGVTVDPSYPAGAPWLSHVLSGYTVTFTVDRTGLANGTYRADVIVSSSNGGSDTAMISMYQGDTVTSNAGAVYVIAENSATHIQYTVKADLADGYHFSITGLPMGYYWLGAGTNINHDASQGDNGELLGAYRDLGNPVKTYISGTMLNNRNFSVQFIGLPVPAQAPIK
jgi:serine protease